MRRLIRPSFLTALLLLAAAEIYLHVTLSPLQIAAFRYGHHPDSGFVETTADRVQLAPGPTRDFHAQNFTRLPAPGVCRIFTLGNSVEYWDAVASHDLTNTYPMRLGEELNQHGFPTESLNLGVTGYGLLRNKILLEKILAYQPSLLILKLDVTTEGTDQITAERSREFCSLWPQAWLWKSYVVQSGLIFKEEHLMKHTLPAPVLVRAFGAVAHAASTNAAPFNEVSRQALTECLQLGSHASATGAAHHPNLRHTRCRRPGARHRSRTRCVYRDSARPRCGGIFAHEIFGRTAYSRNLHRPSSPGSSHASTRRPSAR